jgi:PAS domain S-box-containing protein
MNALIKVLIVEHNPADIELILYALKAAKLDFISETVQNEKDYRNALKTFIPDIILSDYSLPSFNGVQAFNIREQVAHNIPFIFVSGTIGEERSIEHIRNGVTDYVLKESLFTLDSKVRRALLESKERQQKNKIERDLLRSERQLNIAQQIAHVGSWELDFSANSFIFSHEACRIFGVSTDQNHLSFDAWSTSIHPEDRDNVLRVINRSKASFVEAAYNYRIIRCDGTIRYIYSESKFDFDPDGDPQGMYGIAYDVTEKRQAEQQLRNSEDQLAVIYNTVADIIFMLSVEDGNRFKFVSVNHAFLKNTGLREEMVAGQYVDNVIPRPSLELVLLKYNEAIKSRKTVSWEEKSVYPSGIKTGFVTISPVIDENNKCTMLVGSVHDITDRKRAEEEMGLLAHRLKGLNEDLIKQAKALAISNAELEQFAYVASHDLQEPLRMVTSYLTQIEKKYGDIIDEKGKKYIYFAVDGARRMRHIILDLLEFSRVGTTDENTENIDLNELVLQIQVLFKQQIGDKKAMVIVDKLPYIFGHEVPIRQVFQNLVGNALKYARADTPGRIHIAANELNDYWQFSITDNGIGIDKEYFDKIFIIFQRLHNKDEFSGTGMGLAIAKKIVENQGGKIWLDSVAGEGSTFYFTLPKRRIEK